MERAAEIRVCALVQRFRPFVGGAELQLERLLPHLAARGVAVSVITRAHPGAPRSERLPRGQLRRTLVAGTHPLASADYILEGAAHVAARRSRFDLVHAHGTLSEGAIALVGTALRLPALVKVLGTGRDGSLEHLRRRPGGRARVRLLARRAWFVAVSSEARREIERLGVPARRIFDIANGVDGEVFRPAGPHERALLRARLDLPGGPLVAFVGRLHPVKRVEVLVQAVAAVPGVGLVVLGDGPARKRLEALARATRAGDRFHFRGTVPLVADHLRACDAFASPSTTEGLSNALLEAMACGLPCLAASASGVHGLLDGGRGFVVDEAAGDSWADALRALVEDPEEGRARGRRAAEHVREHFTLAATAEKLVDAYRAILDAAGASSQPPLPPEL